MNIETAKQEINDMNEGNSETATSLKSGSTHSDQTETDSGINMDSSNGVLHGIDQYGSDQEETGEILEGKEEVKENVTEEVEIEEDDSVEMKEDDAVVEEEEEEEEAQIGIVEGGLNFILKYFEGNGNFYGLIISYDQPYFRVVYEDADCEELEVQEVEELLVSMASVPDKIITSLKKIAKTISIVGDVDEEEEEEEEKFLPDVDGWKYFVLKNFGDLGDFHGLIVSEFPEEPFYKVVYEDGDCEDMTTAEVKAYLVPTDSVSDEKKVLLRGHAKSSTADASPSDFHDTSSASASDSKKKKKPPKDKVKEKSNSSSSSASKKRKRPREEKTVTATEEKDEEEEDGQEEQEEGAVVAKRLTPSGVEGWKYYVLKSFGDLGDFNGLVISHDKPFYKVVYEDEDCEDLTSAEVKACLVPANSVSDEKKAVLHGHAESLVPKSTSTKKKKNNNTKSSTSTSASSEKKKKKKPTSTGGSGKKKQKASASPTSKHVLLSSSSPAAAAKNEDKNSVFATSSGAVVLQEPVDSYDNYVSKTFFGFGVFYGLLVSCQLPYYRVLYNDGDSEELSREEVLTNLTSPSVIPTKIQNQLRIRAREYKKNPVPFQNEPIDEESPGRTEGGAAGVGTYRDVPEDNIYQQYVGRTFVDMDENITFRVQSVCLHVDYDVLLFKYYDEFQFFSHPEFFDDQDKFEYSACSEMLKADSWCKWSAERQEPSPQQEEEQQEQQHEEQDVVCNEEVAEEKDEQEDKKEEAGAGLELEETVSDVKEEEKEEENVEMDVVEESEDTTETNTETNTVTKVAVAVEPAAGSEHVEAVERQLFEAEGGQ